jgi:hypothetical protein
MPALRQSFILTPAMDVAVDPSDYVTNSTNTYVQNMFHHTLSKTNMFPSFCDHPRGGFIEYEEYNNLPYRIFGATQCVSNIEYFNLHTLTIHAFLSTLVTLPRLW